MFQDTEDDCPKPTEEDAEDADYREPTDEEVERSEEHEITQMYIRSLEQHIKDQNKFIGAVLAQYKSLEEYPEYILSAAEITFLYEFFTNSLFHAFHDALETLDEAFDPDGDKAADAEQRAAERRMDG